jgi:hypothetical protein
MYGPPLLPYILPAFLLTFAACGWFQTLFQGQEVGRAGEDLLGRAHQLELDSPWSDGSHNRSCW